MASSNPRLSRDKRRRCQRGNCCTCDVVETVHELVIVRLSLISGSVSGGDDMIILCEKVKKGGKLSDSFLADCTAAHSMIGYWHDAAVCLSVYYALWHSWSV